MATVWAWLLPGAPLLEPVVQPVGDGNSWSWQSTPPVLYLGSPRRSKLSVVAVVGARKIQSTPAALAARSSYT